MRLHVPHSAGTTDHGEHHVRQALSAAGDASAGLLAALFADSHHERWEDALRRYDVEHPERPTDAQP